MNLRIHGSWRVACTVGLLTLAFWLLMIPDLPAAIADFVLRVMTYNIHHGEGLDGKVDLARIAAVITNADADLVALQEVDKGVTRTARRDLPAELAALTGLSVVFSNNYAYQGGEYGNAILSRFPIASVTNTLYRMLRPGEQRGLLQAVVRTPRGEMVFAATHIDFRGEDAERLMNVGEMKVLRERHGGLPIVLCGDFNDVPSSRTIKKMSENFTDAWLTAGSGEGFTFPASIPTKRIDYQWLSVGAPLKPMRAWVPVTDASDHRPLVVEWRWPVMENQRTTGSSTTAETGK